MGTLTLLNFISEAEREPSIPAAELGPLARAKETVGGLELSVSIWAAIDLLTPLWLPDDRAPATHSQAGD